MQVRTALGICQVVQVKEEAMPLCSALEHACGPGRGIRAGQRGGPTRLTWYQSTRHTYGGRFVSAGGSLEKLRVILGHSSSEVTMRYGHLVRGQFTEQERALADVQLHDAKVLPIRRSARGE